jgi:hypothetical protein
VSAAYPAINPARPFTADLSEDFGSSLVAAGGLTAPYTVTGTYTPTTSGAVSSGLTGFWNEAARVQASLTARWNIRTRVTFSFTGKWNVLIPAIDPKSPLALTFPSEVATLNFPAEPAKLDLT